MKRMKEKKKKKENNAKRNENRKMGIDNLTNHKNRTTRK